MLLSIFDFALAISVISNRIGRCAPHLGSREVKEKSPALPVSKIVGCDVSMCNTHLGCIANGAGNVLQDLHDNGCSLYDEHLTLDQASVANREMVMP